MASTNEATFTISVVGDVTKEKWYGEFKCVKYLSFRQNLMRDRIRRELIGDLAQYASDAARDQSYALADLAVALVKVPDWWKEAGNGQDLQDPNVLDAVWAEVAKVWGVLKTEDKKKTVEDAKALKKAVDERDAEKELTSEQEQEA